MLHVLDLFCGGGGASHGYVAAGCKVTGVDYKTQRSYRYEFIQHDIRRLTVEDLIPYDFIHASPPCQDFSVTRPLRKRVYGDYIPFVRTLLRASGKPYIIENVRNAPLHRPVLVCGSHFGLGVRGTMLYRHRYFETSFTCNSSSCQHVLPALTIMGRSCSAKIDGKLVNLSKQSRQRAMEIDWMTNEEMAQAIPPAYTEFLVRQYIRAQRYAKISTNTSYS